MPVVPRALSFALSAFLAIGLAAADGDEETINRCRDANGNVVFQTDPCEETPVARKVTPPGPAAAPAPVPRIPDPARRFAPVRVPRASFPTSPGQDALASDARFASPQQTWKSLLAAIRLQDRAAAAACFTPSARARYGADDESLSLDALQDEVSTFTRIEIEGDLGPFWSVRALRANRRPKWIFFERTAGGEWKIAGM